MEYSQNQLNKTSKFLSFVLRHQPEAIDLTLDDSGWALISEIIDKADSKLNLSYELIEHTTITNDKKRFLISDDGLRIRANQGHSIKVDLQLSPEEPPTLLFHGTATRFLDSIKQEGLKAGQRQHVHLSTDKETASAVGKRYGKLVMLKVNANDMYQQGYEFFLSENGVWLTASVPPNFLSVQNV